MEQTSLELKVARVVNPAEERRGDRSQGIVCFEVLPSFNSAKESKIRGQMPRLMFFRQRMRFEPEGASCTDRVQSKFRPPNCLVAVAMEFPMMAATEGDGELV
ncbi:MAG TPA: hypothetical protein VGG11_21005, partial [Xanthobacteraceae bacterium]